MKSLTNLEIQMAKTGSGAVDLVNGDAAELLSYYLRAGRGRSDLSEQVLGKIPTAMFSSAIEFIRSLIWQEKYIDAKILIDVCLPTNALEQIELNLEKGRFYFFSDEFLTAQNILENIISAVDAPITTRMTAHELLGQTHLNLGNVTRAENHLQKAMEYLLLLPYMQSGFVAGAYLVKICAEQNRLKEAEMRLDFLKAQLKEIKHDDAWLSRLLLTLRAEIILLRQIKETKKEQELLLEALRISQWLEDKYIERKCLQELEVVPKISQALQFLPLTGVLLFHRPKDVRRFDNHPALAKLLSALTSGPKTYEELNLQVWNEEYDKEKHALRLRSALSKLRKRLPPNTLIVQDSLVSLA